MTTQFLKKLAELDEGASPGDFTISTEDEHRIEIHSHGHKLFSEGYNPQAGDWTTSNLTLETWQLLCFLRNNSKAIRELVEAAENLKDNSHICDNEAGIRCTNCHVIEALAAFKVE